MNDGKPRPALVRLLNDLADYIAIEHRLGLPPAILDRVIRECAARGPTVPAAIPPPADWRDGRWTRDEPEPDTEQEMNMPKVSEMYPSRWLAAADLENADHVVTITDIDSEEVAKGEAKWIVHFKELDKGLVLNKTNTRMIALLLGDDTDDWLGRRITLFATQVDFQGEQFDAIRVRKKLPKPVAAGKGGGGKPAWVVTQQEADQTDDEFRGDDDDSIPY
jgi:hypothetical protein